MESTFYTILSSVVLAVLVGLPIMFWLTRKNQFQVDGRTVVITGASQGMGLAVAKLLASKGANIVLVARDIPKLQKALDAVTAAKVRDSQRFKYISADVTKADENDRIIKEVTQWNEKTPDIVWTIAGTSHPTLFLDTSLETLRSQMDINYWSATYLAHSTLRAWLQPVSNAASSDTSLPKHFIMTSSSAAFVSVAGYLPYSPSKAALRSLADGLRSEINLYNGARSRDTNPSQPEVKIHCIFPGTILSPGLEHENTMKHEVTKILEDGDPEQTPEQVAQVSVSGLERGQFLIATNWLAKLMRISSLQGSPRNGWGISDTIVSWVTAIAWLFIGPDMESKVYKWGKKNGVQVKS